MKGKYIVITLLMFQLSACVTSIDYFQLTEGSASGEISSYPTNVYEVKISNTVTAHLWIYGGFDRKATLTAEMNIPKGTSVKISGNTVSINSDVNKQLLIIKDIQIRSNIPDGYTLTFEDNSFMVTTNTFNIQLPDMLINNVLVKPPALKFIKSNGTKLITIS